MCKSCFARNMPELRWLDSTIQEVQAKEGRYPACEGRRREITKCRGLNGGRRHAWLTGGLCKQLLVPTLGITFVPIIIVVPTVCEKLQDILQSFQRTF